MSRGMSGESREVGRLEHLSQSESGTRASKGELRAPYSLKDTMPYSPSDLHPLVAAIAAESKRLREHIREGELTSQLKGELAERATAKAFGAFGEVTKLPVGRIPGSHTADFLVVLRREIRIGRHTYSPVDKLVVEVKTGSNAQIKSELRDEQSHGRRQLQDTIEREQAQGGVCIVPREMQSERPFVERVKAQMNENPSETGVTVLMAGPHEGAMRRAIELHKTRAGA